MAFLAAPTLGRFQRDMARKNNAHNARNILAAVIQFKTNNGGRELPLTEITILGQNLNFIRTKANT